MVIIFLEIVLQPVGELNLPIHYHHLVQAAILEGLGTKSGFEQTPKVLPLFTFSRLWGVFRLERAKGRIIFHKQCQLRIASPVEAFCHSLAQGWLAKGYLKLGNQKVGVQGIKMKKDIIQGNSLIVKTLSPIVVYRVLHQAGGDKHTYYLQPGEADYNYLLGSNLRRKYVALYGAKPPDGQVEAVVRGTGQFKIVKVKKTLCKGYWGELFLQGPQPLLQVGVELGLGGKNRQGFGCLEIIKGSKERLVEELG